MWCRFKNCQGTNHTAGGSLSHNIPLLSVPLPCQHHPHFRGRVEKRCMALADASLMTSAREGKAGMLSDVEIGHRCIISQSEACRGVGLGVLCCPSALHTMNSLLPYSTICCGMSGGSLPWPSLSLECLRDESRVPFSFCLPRSGLKVPRLVN